MAVTSVDIQQTYAKLLAALDQLQTYLDSAGTITTLKTAIAAVKQYIPQVGLVVTTLLTLMQELQTTLDSVSQAGLDDIAKIEAFAQAISSLLQAAQALIPAAQQSLVDDVLKATTLVAGFPDLVALKDKIDAALTAIITDLKQLQ